METLQEQKSTGIERIAWKDCNLTIFVEEKICRLEEGCGVEVFGFQDKSHLREIAKIMTDSLKDLGRATYIQTINEQNLTYTIVRKE